jgi:HK97 gp10 family phage protein
MPDFLRARIDADDAARLRARLADVEREMEEAMRKAIEKAVLTVHADARRSILKGPKTGRLYKRRGIEHRASAPGEPPATDTGRLVGSVTFELEPSRPVGFVRAATAYAKALEFGTMKMAARPFLQPALEKNRQKISALIANAAKAVLRRQRGG